METGVYLIRNRATGSVYVGSTAVGFEGRWKGHQKFLRLGYHRNIHLQRAWNKYGEGAFEFQVLERVSGKAEILAAEQKWIDFYKGTCDCYNISPKAQSVLGLKWTEDAKRKKAQQTKNLYHNPKTRQAAYTGIRAMHSPDVRKRVLDSVRRIPKEKRREMAVMGARALRANPTSWQKVIDAISKTYDGFIAPDGTVYRNIKNLTQFCREHGLIATAMSRVNSGKSLSHKKWRRIKL